MSDKKDNILHRANNIVNYDSEAKDRQYGGFQLNMRRMSEIATAMAGRPITVDECYICLIAVKLARQSTVKQEDNLLDAAAYIGAWQNYLNTKHDTSDE